MTVRTHVEILDDDGDIVAVRHFTDADRAMELVAQISAEGEYDVRFRDCEYRDCGETTT